ncbi:uncharacterized protein LOC118557340 [Fundulus heteroclitus]|uniref:uncharacterized protein LOC118557340 n=1 Tax=Fundulus heteroclitus TaxID=8078 RepID=UPI00165A511A|nr:uncharacterized protein LOC118557340 [Fundulus heteroclitus]
MKYQSNTWLYWFKQSAGDTLNLIVMQQRTTSPKYQPEFSDSRFNVTYTDHGSNLTILSIVEQDEGMYHCSQKDTLESTWSGTYLSIKENSTRTSSYTVVQESTSVQPKDSETLQCSVLSDSGNKTCSGEPSVLWFRAGSAKSFPDIIYMDAKGAGNCEKRSDTQKRCVYNFSKNISSSDAGTYYCAVATCGQILFANEISLKKDKTNETHVLVVTTVTAICLVISLIGNIVFIYFQIRRSPHEQIKENSSSQTRRNFNQKGNDTESGPDLNYAALHFSERKTSKGKRKKELMTEESVYSQVR